MLDYEESEKVTLRTVVRIKKSELLSARDGLQFDMPSASLDLEDGEAAYEFFPVELTTYQAGSDLRIKGKAALKLKEICDRCLTPFENEIVADFQLILTEQESLLSGDDETDIFFLAHNQSGFDFGPIIRESILLERSMKRLCKEDCRGLCPNCGANLNERECQCQTDSLDERWAPLKELDFSSRKR